MFGSRQKKEAAGDKNASKIPPQSPLLPKTQVNRLSVVAFVTDVATEVVLREGLAGLVTEGVDVRRGPIRSAIAFMMRISTPDVLIIDISGQENPLRALSELCDVIEPSTRLLVLGDIDNVDLYRHITRDIGAADYFFKPITLEMIGRQLAPLITSQSALVQTMAGDSSRGGRVIAVTGARGGVGASTVAASLAWRLGVDSNRHTVLVDADIYTGVIADTWEIDSRTNLSELLERNSLLAPATLDDITDPVDGRLHLLAGRLPGHGGFSYAAGNAQIVIDALRLRYNFIVLDIPYLPISSHRELLELAHHRLIVLDASLASLRDTLRLLELSTKPKNLQRPTLVLNRGQRPGSLTRKQMEDGLKRRVDFLIPDLPRQFSHIRNRQNFLKLQQGPFGRAVENLALELGFAGGSAKAKSG